MIQPAFEILNQRGTPMFFSDVFANRPAAGIIGRIFISTDTKEFYRDTGSTWELLAGPGSGSVTGSGVAGQVTFWNGTSSVSGSNDLWFDNASSKFLVGTNNTTGAGKLQVTSATGDDQLRVWGATSPSIRIDNAVSGATQRFVMGLATATNNFIQGSTAGDICISTASASPLLFGMWQTINASEVMRITTALNLLIGSSVDGGQRLQVNGTTNLTNTLTIGPLGAAVAGVQISGNDQANTRIKITNTGGSSFSIVTGNPGASNVGFAIFDETAASTRFYITSTGNFGFNTNNPLVPYHFAFRQGEGDPTTFTGERMRLQGNDNNGRSNFFTIISGSNSYGGFYVGDNSDAQIGKIRYYNLNNSWEFHSNGSLAMTIANTQNILIGSTTDQGQKLYLNGSFRIDGQTSGTAGGNSGQHLIINCDGTTYKIALLNP